MAFNLEARFTADAARFNRTIAAMETRFSSFTRGVTSGLNKVNSMAGSVHAGLTKVAMGAAAAGLGLGVVGKNIIETGANFEAALSSVSAKSGATGAELDKLKAKALELGSITKFTSTEVVGAMEAMVKSGFKVDETLAGVGGILAAAAADGATIEETSASIMASMKGLGLGPEKMQGFADMLAKAGDTTAASIGTLTESMAKFGPIARQLDIPVSSAVAQLALLQDAGLDAATSGTSLAAVYSKLAAPMGATEKALKTLRIQVKDSVTGDFKKPHLLMAEIIRATDGIKGNAGKMAAVTNLVGLESQKALLNMTAAAKEGKLSKLTQDLQELESATVSYSQVMANKMLDNFSGDVTKLGAAVDTLKVKLFDTQKGPLRGIAQGMTAWVKANEGLITSKVGEFLTDFRDNLPQIVTWTKRIGTGVAVFYGLAFAVKAAQTALVVYNGIVKTASFLTAGYKLITKSTTLAKGASAAATWAQVAAQTVQNAVSGLGSKAMRGLGLATTATTGATNAATAASGRAAMGFGTMAASAGAAAAALGSVMLAMDQADKLAKETGGLGVTGTIGKMWDMGTFDPFEAVDAHMNEQAISKAARVRKAPKAPRAGLGMDLQRVGLDPESMQSMVNLQKHLTSFEAEPPDDPLSFYPAPQRAPKASPLVVGPQDRLTQVIESRTKHTEETEVTIKTPPGTDARITKAPKGNTKLRIAQSGGI